MRQALNSPRTTLIGYVTWITADKTEMIIENGSQSYVVTLIDPCPAKMDDLIEVTGRLKVNYDRINEGLDFSIFAQTALVVNLTPKQE